MLLFLLLSHLSLSGGVQSGIFGGREAKAHSRPYMASLQTRGHHGCGGVLIREDYVLTAAHCLNRSDPLDSVVLGAHDISKQEKSQQRISFFKPIPHPKYPKKTLPNTDPRTREHDIMLLKLKTKARQDKFVKVLDLPKKYGKIRAGTKCEVAGWGQRGPKKREESVLYEANVRLDEVENCQKWQQYYNQDQMTCSVPDGRGGFCQGDSGGPLICGKILYGVTAYTGNPCNTKEYPEVYTRVPYFLPWIKEVIRKNGERQTK